MTTKVVNIYKETYDVYIGRAGKGKDGYFGNPFKLVNEAERADVLKKYESWFAIKLASDAEFREKVYALRGKRLGCFCAPKACHGHIIANYLNAMP